MEQRSKEWFRQRLGRFTASTIHKLMGIKGLGDTGNTLAFEKAVEIVFGSDESWNVETWDMRRGTSLEPEAYDFFKKLMARKHFIEVNKATFFPNGNDSGSSPDAIVGTDAIGEIKCPRPEKFFKLVKDGIEAIEPAHISQMQKQMHDTNSVRCHYFIYLIFNDKQMHHEIIVERDELYQEFIEDRIRQAVVKRDEYVEQLIKNKQF